MTLKNLGLVASVGLVTLLYGASPAAAQTAPSLGSAQGFAVLGASTVTNTGSSFITGDLGVSPGTAVTGFPFGTGVYGTIHSAGAAALAAQTSATAAYNDLASQACTEDLTGQDLGGKTLTAGVYCFSSSAQLTGTLTLNAQGNAGAVFIFKMGSTLTTASGSSVVLINGAAACNVFWQVGSSATLGTTTSLAGNVLALASITLTTGASVTGRTMALTGAVTLDTNAVSATACAAAPAPASTIASNYTFEIPIVVPVLHPCRTGVVAVEGKLLLDVTTLKGTDFRMDQQVKATAEGVDADVNGVSLFTTELPYAYTAETIVSAEFPDGTPEFFAPTFAISGQFVRSETDEFTMTTELEIEFVNGIPALPKLVAISVRCR